MEDIVVIGAGVMGTALAIHLANNEHPVRLWGTEWDDKTLEMIEKKHQHPALADLEVPSSIKLYRHDQLEEALDGTKLVIVAVLSQGMEAMSKELSQYLNEDHVLVNITKGIHGESLDTMTNVIRRTLKPELQDKVALVKLGGPVIASELAHGKFTEAVFASKNIDAARYARDLFESDTFKASVSEDVDGVELSASFKNSYAIAMGIIQGVEKDTNNAKAALMARGTVEMANIVRAYGGNPLTASGIAGVGDYYVTSQGGRNGIFGTHIGNGLSIDQALEAMNHQTVEGIAATKNGHMLLEKLQDEGKIDIEKETPLFHQLYQILFEGKDAKEAMGHYWSKKSDD